VIDASDATQMGQFAKELADHRAINARRIENGQEPIVGFTKFRVRSSHNHNSHF
jgi:methylmalonyl-CoA mutase N-terminal domain/subunit